ncbi:hypothetical protein [Leptotrichia hongkongensis]
MLAKLFEHSEFFFSAEKYRRLAIGYCVAILPNWDKYLLQDKDLRQ